MTDRIDVVIEHKPQEYVGAEVSITIKAKPSARHIAEYLRQLILSDEEGRDHD